MRVAAFDISLTRTGIATPGRVFSAAFATKGTARLAELRRCVFHAARDVDVAVLEAVVPGKNALAGQALAGAHAVAELALYDCAVPWFEVWPVHLKLWASGDVRASKETMLSLARARCLGAVPDHDAADAFHLWSIGMHLTGRPVFAPNAVQRKALERVRVPDGLRRKINLARSA